MKKFTFDENISKEEFEKLAHKKGVKSHFLGSYTWGLVSERNNWTPYYVGARDDTGEVVATALLLKKNLLRGYTYFYIPRGFTMDYEDRELLQFMTTSIDGFCRKHKSLYFKIDPDIKLHTLDADGKVIQGEENSELVCDLKRMGYTHQPLNYLFEAEQPRFTFRISTAEDIDTVQKRYGSIVKRRLRQVKSNGVEVVEGTAADIPEFNRLMAVTEKRQGFYSHPSEYYQFFYDTLAKDDMVSLYLSKLNIPKLQQQLRDEIQAKEEEKQDKENSGSRKAQTKAKELEKVITARKEQLAILENGPQEELTISALILVRYVDKAWFLYGGNDLDYGKFYGNYAVLGHCLEDSCRRGLSFLDAFGTVGKTGIDKQLDGIHAYKRHWGGEYTEFVGEFVYVQNRPLYAIYSKLIPLYHKMVNRRLRKKVQEDA